MVIIGLALFFIGLGMLVYAGVIDQTVSLVPSIVITVLGFIICIISNGA